jgi:4'-phosphopantetheinyl transferase
LHERPPPSDDLARLALHPDEYSLFASLSPETKNFLFYQYWSSKEALLKAIGTGLTQAPSEIHLDFADLCHPRAISFGRASPSVWFLSAIEAPIGFSGYIATDKKPEKISYKNFSREIYG